MAGVGRDVWRRASILLWNEDVVVVLRAVAVGESMAASVGGGCVEIVEVMWRCTIENELDGDEEKSRRVLRSCGMSSRCRARVCLIRNI